MKKTVQSLTAALLAGLMLLSTVACAATTDEGPVTTEGVSEVVTEAETKDPNYVCELPDDLNFGGTEVHMVYTNNAGREDELPSEKLGLGSISDAVYERNLMVETRLGVKLMFVEKNGDGDANNSLQTVVRAGDTTLDIFSFASYQAIPSAISGNYLDLTRVDNVNLEKHYWVQDYNNIVTFTDENMQFLATSPAALSMFRLTYLTIFNKDLFEDRRLENLYDVVDRGAWTLDYQYGLAADAYVDLDGDGQASPKDFYGYVTGDLESLDAHLVASGIRVAIRDENGQWVFNSEKLDDIADMVTKVCALNTSAGSYIENNDGIGVYDIIDKFAREESLMATTIFLALERRIEPLTEIGYGIVPMPKLNQNQADYYTFVQDQVSAFGISAAIGKADRQATLGAVMEAIAYYSNEIVRPAYYDTSLSLRFMQDPQSRDMLDIMFETLSFDLGYYVGLGNVRSDMRNILRSRNPAVASKFKSWEKMAQNTLKSYGRSLDKILKKRG